MANEKKKRENKYDNNYSIHGSFEDVIKASVLNPVKSREEIQRAIINIINLGKDNQWTIEILCEKLQEYMREEIVNALVDMKDVTVLNSGTGAIQFHPRYYK
jgi:hypothetical protein